MAAHFLRDKGHEEPPSDFVEIYRGALSFAIRRPWAIFGLGGVVFVFSIFLATQVPMTFIPRFDNGMIQARVEIPPGTPVIEADRVLQRMSARIRENPEVIGVFSSCDTSARSCRRARSDAASASARAVRSSAM